MPTAIQEVSVEELKQIDGIVVIDHSGSMSSGSTRFANKTRYQEVEEAAGAIAREMQHYDDDGITVIHFSSSVTVHDNVKSDKVAEVFKEHRPAGSTALHLALQAAIDKAKTSTKQAVIVVYTDGAPDDERAVISVIEQAGRTLGRPKIGFVFVQVGNDGGASAFLDKLDTGMSVDVTATVRAADADLLTVPQLAWLARNK